VTQYAQYAVGIALVIYAAFLAFQKVRGLLAFGTGRTAIPTDDVRIVSDLATRLRSQRKTAAVEIALQLHAELLKPEEPRT
jgi:hypothetical protein